MPNERSSSYLVQILLPRADNSGNPFPPEDFEQLKEELARHFQGVTVYARAPAEGIWKHDGGSSEDDVVIFEVMTGELDLPAWQGRRATLEERFRQDRVIIRYQTIGVV